VPSVGVLDGDGGGERVGQFVVSSRRSVTMRCASLHPRTAAGSVTALRSSRARRISIRRACSSCTFGVLERVVVLVGVLVDVVDAPV
jgi:hypothetical protein